MSVNEQYINLIKRILAAPVRPDRTGQGSRCVTGERIVADGDFPIITAKRVLWRNAICELLWMIGGSTNTKDLIGPKGKTLTLWDVNQRQYAERHARNGRVIADGDLGPIYGKQWTSWANPDGFPIHQLEALIDSIRADPFSRRHMVTAFNPAELDSALPPCIPFFQVVVRKNEEDLLLDMIVTQRSADCLLGLPFNLVQYAALQAMIASLVGMKSGRYVHNIGDAHVYMNHEKTAHEMVEHCRIRDDTNDPDFMSLEIQPRERKYLSDFTIDDFKLHAMTFGSPLVVRNYHDLDLPTFTGLVN